MMSPGGETSPLGGDMGMLTIRGGPSSGWTGGCRRLPKRLGAVTVGYKCHWGWHLAFGDSGWA